MVHIKRAYEPARSADGQRILIDRLWPRGLRKDKAHFDEWLKAIAPSDQLRKWFGHDPRRWEEFRQRYRRELDTPAAQELLEGLARRAGHGTVTLIYSAHDEFHNDAVVLAEELALRMTRPELPAQGASARKATRARHSSVT